LVEPVPTDSTKPVFQEKHQTSRNPVTYVFQIRGYTNVLLVWRPNYAITHQTDTKSTLHSPTQLCALQCSAVSVEAAALTLTLSTYQHTQISDYSFTKITRCGRFLRENLTVPELVKKISFFETP
jgi:hypothetical protein